MIEMELAEYDFDIICGLKNVVRGYTAAFSEICPKEIKEKFGNLIMILEECEKLHKGYTHVRVA